jgi:hypothetical protein
MIYIVTIYYTLECELPALEDIYSGASLIPMPLIQMLHVTEDCSWEQNTGKLTIFDSVILTLH